MEFNYTTWVVIISFHGCLATLEQLCWSFAGNLHECGRGSWRTNGYRYIIPKFSGM